MTQELKPTTITFTIKGICPLKMDKWVEGVQPKNQEGYKKQAEEKVYRNSKGNIVIPAEAIKAVMRYASSEIGKRTDAKKNRQTIQSAVYITDDLDLNRKDHDGIVVDIVTRGQGAKVTRVPTYRPFIKEWSAKGIMHLFGVPEPFVKECLELGGLRYGLLSHRPAFGRFTVIDWKTAK